MKAHPLLLLSLVAFLICSMVVPAAAQGPAPDSHGPILPLTGPAQGPQKDANGLWFMPKGASVAASAAPGSSGGPDDFGYTWTDQVPLAWIDASGGTNTGINNSQESAGPFDIGFPFKFYENIRSQVYVSRHGFLSFTNQSLWNSQSQVPSVERPNEVIAPHWVPVRAGVDYVKYLRGGSAPNRWFAVEWRKVRSDCCGGDGTEEYTFEAVLHENGDIFFQYGDTYVKGNWYCQASGIEDSTGLVGLPTSPNCQQIAPKHAVKITRPAPAARVSLFPHEIGAFGSPGEAVTFNETVRNTGELGTDTFDLYVSGGWQARLYHADGSTLLTDTDGDSVIDTGPVDQGASKTVVVKSVVPASAVVGNQVATTLQAYSSRNPMSSKTAVFQIAVPAAFASSYSQSGRSQIGLHRPRQQSTVQTSDSSTWANNAAAATLPDGRIAQVWYESRDRGNNRWAGELYYSVVQPTGETSIARTRITDLSAESASSAYDESPSLAATPDGRIGVTWYRYLYRSSTDEYNYNIWMMVLDGRGGVVSPPVNLTNNGAWVKWNSSNTVQVYDPVIAPTPDNRFGIAWQRYTYDGSTSRTTTWYAVRRSDGSEVRGPTQFFDARYSYDPNLAPLADGTMLLVQRVENSLNYGRIDSSGNIVTPPTIAFNNYYPNAPDAVQLPNGNIIVAWTSGNVGYAVFDRNLHLISGAHTLPNMSDMGDQSVSITASGSRAVLTWGDGCCDYYPNLYYALLDDGGNVVTSPLIMFSDYNNYYVQLPYNGQGNTPLIGDTTPPANPTGLNSPSHAVSTWSKDNTVDLSWTAAVDDDSGVDGYSILWDQKANSVPDTTKDAGPVTSATSPALADGAWYVHLRAVDAAGNWAQGATHLGPFKIDTTAPSCGAHSPDYVVGPIPVTWGGYDAGSGIVSYDIWAASQMDGGTWTKWLAGTSSKSAEYAAPVGDVARFQCAATDALGNVEVEGFNVEWSQTTVAAKSIRGTVANVREEPIFDAEVYPFPVESGLNRSATDVHGHYEVFFGTTTGSFRLVPSGGGRYYPLPGMQISNLAAVSEPIDFVLPPLPNWFGNLTRDIDLDDWSVSGSPRTDEAAARTGELGLQLGGSVSQAISRTVTLPAGEKRPTLSLFFRVVDADPSAELRIEADTGSETRTETYALTERGWTHVWLDLEGFQGKEVAVRIRAQAASTEWEAHVDEISLGGALTGSYPIFLPALRR